MANKKIPKKATKTNKILQAVLACLLVVIIGGSVILGVGFGVYGKDTAKWFKPAPKTQTEQVVDEKPGDEQPGEQPGAEDPADPGENPGGEQPGTEDPQDPADPGEEQGTEDPAVEHALNVGDVVKTLYLDTAVEPDFAKLDWSKAVDTIIDDVPAKQFNLITVEEAIPAIEDRPQFGDKLLTVLKVAKADFVSAGQQVPADAPDEVYFICFGANPDNMVYVNFGVDPSHYLMSKIEVAETFEIDIEDATAAKFLTIKEINGQDFLDEFVSLEKIHEFSVADRIEKIYFNTNEKPDLASLDWDNAYKSTMFDSIPLITRQIDGSEYSLLSAIKVAKDVEGRTGEIGFAYALLIGKLDSSSLIYTQGAKNLLSLEDGWHIDCLDVDKYLEGSKLVYRVYNEEFVEKLCAQEPFEGVDYANPLIAEGEQVTTLYFNTNETPDFEKLEWDKATSLMNLSQNGASLTYDGLSLVKGDGFHIYAVKSEISGSTDENFPNGIEYDIIISQGDMVVDGPTLGYIKVLYSSNMGWRNSNVNVVEFNQDYSSDEYRTIQNLSEAAFWDSFINDAPFEGVDYNA